MQYLSLADAAARLATTRDYLNVLIHRGKLRGVKIGRNWVTTEPWLAEYTASRRAPHPVSSETLATLEALKEAFSQWLTPSREFYAVPTVSYSLRSLNAVHFVARNPLLAQPSPPRQIRLVPAYLTVFGALAFLSLVTTHPSALSFPADVGLAWSEKAIELPQRLSALDLPLRVEGDFVLVDIPNPHIDDLRWAMIDTLRFLRAEAAFTAEVAGTHSGPSP